MFSIAQTFITPAQCSEKLLTRLARNEHFTPDLIEELRQMLATYPPLAIARNIEAACDQLVEEGQCPGFPDNGEMDAYLDLLQGLWKLGRVVELTYPLAAA